MLILLALVSAAAVCCWPGRRGAPIATRVRASAVRRVRRDAPRRARWRRRSTADDVVLQEFLGGVAAGLAAGLPPTDALAGARRALGPRLATAPRLVEWLARLDTAVGAGQPLGPVWGALGRELGLRVATQVGRAWSVSERLGSPLTDAVRSTLAAHETTARLQRAFAAQSAGPRATVHVLTCLPVLGLVMMPVLGVDLAAAYPPPVLLLVVLPGAALLLLGRVVTRRMIDRALRTPRLT